MAEFFRDVQMVDSITDPELNWVAPEPRSITSSYVVSLEDVFMHIKDGVDDSGIDKH